MAKNVVRACREGGVERLIYTGSADVVVDGRRFEIDGANESVPYPDKFADDLNELRAQVETLILNANGRDGLSTCVLRPSNPFGPGDEHFVPFLVGGTKLGWAKFIVGSGKNMWDFTYVENVAHANLCAEEALHSGSASVAGKPFFITNHERVKLWDFISTILEGLGYPRPNIRIPVKGVLLLHSLAECLCGKLGLCRANNPFIPVVIYSLSCTRTFDSSKAQKLLGYSPIVSLEDGVSLTVESFSPLAKCLPYSRQREFLEPSKAESMLGGGKVAEILLWRDQKLTFTCLLGLFLLFHWFFLSGRTFISSSAKFLLLLTVIIFGQGSLPSSVFGFRVQKIPSSYFTVSEIALRDSLITVASFWNRGFFILKLVAKGDNWNVFIKVAGFLYLVKLLLPFSFKVLICAGLICLFSFFIIYEQYEGEVDKLVATAASGLRKLQETAVAKFPSLLTLHKSKGQ